MNGVHDMGGMHGFGPVVVEHDEPVFHAEWERHAYAMRVACGIQGVYNGDESRRWIESVPPARYLRLSYYELWLESIASNLIAKGLTTSEELAEREAFYRDNPDAVLPRHANPDLIQRLLDRRTAFPGERAHNDQARFAAGDRVMTRVIHPHGHTRLPRYARGKPAVIERVHGRFPLPDANAHGQGPQPEPVYTVLFQARDLWGEDADPNSTLSLDLWESYLLPFSDVDGGHGD